MIKILGIISGIICTLILFVNLLSYLLQDIYFKINILNVRKLINKLLPILSKYNRFLLISCFIFFLIHITCLFKFITFFNLNIFILTLLIIIITFDLNLFSKVTSHYLRKFASYIIIIFVLFHIFKF